MNALLLESNGVLSYGPRGLKCEEDWVLVKPAYAGICGSDIGRAFKNGAYGYPLVMGHEFAGVVAALPRRGSSFKIGDGVAVFPLLPCGECEECRAGFYNMCVDYDYLGSRRDGAFAECVYVPEWNLVKLPEHVSLLEAALAEPAAVSHHAIAKLHVEKGSSAAVFGGGAIGLMAAQWLRIAGADKIWIADIDDRKLSLALKMGFEPINAKREDPVSSLLRRTCGHGVDCCVEACGLAATRLQTVSVAARRGKIVFIGNAPDSWTIEKSTFSQILRRELNICGSWNSRIEEDWLPTLENCGRSLHLKELVTHQLPLARGMELFDTILKGEEFVCRAVLSVNIA